MRKWHELVLTWGLEHNLRKSRILELYLNVAEFGRGIYGVQAAAQAYYGVDVGSLSLVQAAELAASLPSPVKNNPATRTERFQRRTQRILDLLTREQSATAMDGGSAGREAVPPGTNAGAVFRPQTAAGSAPFVIEGRVTPVPSGESAATGQ
jgi:monofunctional biosynthetic peptidoglycan transglycosylase